MSALGVATSEHPASRSMRSGRRLMLLGGRGNPQLAQAIAAELERRGHRALIHVAEGWDDAEARGCDLALHVRGPWPYVPRADQPSVLWTTAAHAAEVAPGEAARFAALVGGDDVAAGVDAALATVAPAVAAVPALAH